MRYMVRQSDIAPYSPANHTGTRNFRLIGPEADTLATFTARSDQDDPP